MRRSLQLFAFAALLLCTAREGRAQGSWSTDSSNGFYAVGAAGSFVLKGKIYLIGGSHDGLSMVDTVQIFDPITHTWTPGPSLPTPRYEITCNSVNGKIYAFGGYDAIAPYVANTLEIFDSATNTWSEGPPMPIRRDGHTSSFVNGKIYLIGGFGDSLSNGVNVTLNSVDVFDPATNIWSTAAPMPTPRAFHTSSVLNGKIYVIGGVEYSDNALNTVEIFNPDSNSWSVGPHLVGLGWYGMSNCGSSILNGSIYVMGGFYNSDFLEIFDAFGNAWTTGPAFPGSGSGDLSCVALNGRIYAMGGLDLEYGAFNYNEVFTPDSPLETSYIDTDYHMNPNTAAPGKSVIDTAANSVYIGEAACGLPIGIYLQQGSSIIPIALDGGSAYPDTLLLNFQVPAVSDTGRYNLVLIGGIGCEGDTLIVPSAFTIRPVADVAEVNSGSGIRVFPNPALDVLQIMGGQAGSLHLFDLMGRERMNAATDGCVTSLDISHIEAGLYFLRLGDQSLKVEIEH